MKNIKLKVVAALVAGSTLFGVVSPAYASPISGDSAQQIITKQTQYKEMEAKITALHMDIDVILDEITINMAKIDETNAKIAEIEAAKKLVEKDIRIQKTELAQKELEYGDRLRAMYKQGNTGIIDAILGSESLSDFVSRADAIIEIAKIDKAMLDEIDALKKALEGKKSTLQGEISQMNALNEENQKNLAAIEVKKKESDAKLALMEAEEAVIEGDLALSEAALLSESEKVINNSSSTDAQLNSAIVELREARKKVILDTIDDKIVILIETAKDIVAKRATVTASVSPVSSVAVSASSSAIVSYAYQFLGVPYVWGGNTPSGFDCSGFTKYVYNHFGVTLPRVSRDQAKVGAYVPISQAQPGDLLYFGETSVTHVGIYIGNNKMIHAPSPGKNVMITDISWHVSNYNIVGARRIISN